MLESETSDMEQGSDLRRCKRCLTREMTDQMDIYGTIREYLEGLEESMKSSEQVYEERLALCKQCEMLLEGMCRKCGCYVEVRAAVQRNTCPWKRW